MCLMFVFVFDPQLHGLQHLGLFPLGILGLFVEPETHKGLKLVSLICLLCPMLVIIHFRKYHIWKEKKR